MKLRLIGLHGPAGCGKDTVAQILCVNHGFRRISLAGPLKLGLEVMLDIPSNFLTDRHLKEKSLKEICGIDKTPRQLMQTLGTEWGRRMVDPNLWLDIAQKIINNINKQAEARNINGIVISDIRLGGEAQWLRSQGGEIWSISRDNNPCAIESEHESEIQLAPGFLDKQLANNGSIEQLAAVIDIIMDQSTKEETA